MFLCQSCHRQGGCLLGVIHPTSRGICEDCRKTASCLDCHNYNNTGMGREELPNEADRINAMVDEDAHYWLMGDGEWAEVTMAEFVNAERSAGFYNTMGRPDRPATGGFFSSSGSGRATMRGAVTYTGEPPKDWKS